jgi:hypothetical protein
MRCQHLPCGAIDIGRRRPRFDGFYRRCLRVSNRGMKSDGVR